MQTLEEREKILRERREAREINVCKICGLMQAGFTITQIAHKLNLPESTTRSLSHSIKRPDLKAD